jgi:hypothetical protein
MEILEGILIGAVGGAAAGLVVYLCKVYFEDKELKKDKATVYKWLKANSHPEKDQYKSATKIASFCNLTPERVKYVCSKHEDIYLYEGGKEHEYYFSLYVHEPELGYS